MMQNPTEIQDVFNRLITLNQTMFADGNYETAYHFLAAAQHCAHAGESIEFSREVERIAKEQLRHIDATAPGDKLSSQSVNARHGVNVYATLANQAAVYADFIHSAQSHAHDLETFKHNLDNSA